MRVWWLEKLPARRASFVWEFIPRQTKTVSSILLETVMFHYRGATQIDCFSPLCSHTIICAGRITGPDPAGTYCWFGASLESPFLKCSHTAIPPPAALCEDTIENVLLFLNGFSCLVMGIIVRKGLFVKKNNKKSLETGKLRRTERKMVISKKNITFQKLP